MDRRQDRIPDKMYHRLYRLMKRGVDPAVIAATLDLPLNTVNGIISKLKKTADIDRGRSVFGNDTYLDIYFFPKTRYARLQIVGALVKENLEVLENELEKVLSSKWKVVALEMCDSSALDETCSKAILDFFNEMKKSGRYTAILDPSPDIDSSLEELGVEGTVPIFGTKAAFIEKAFPKGGSFKPKS